MTKAKITALSNVVLNACSYIQVYYKRGMVKDSKGRKCRHFTQTGKLLTPSDLDEPRNGITPRATTEKTIRSETFKVKPGF